MPNNDRSRNSRPNSNSSRSAPGGGRSGHNSRAEKLAATEHFRSVNSSNPAPPPRRALPPNPPKQKGGGPKILGQPMSFWNQEFTCAPCGTNISGEIAFAQHCQGGKHANCAGFRGFAGLLPNKAGITPTPSPICLQACGGEGGKAPAAELTSVGLTREAQDLISKALNGNSKQAFMEDEDEDEDEPAAESSLGNATNKRRMRSSPPNLMPPPMVRYNGNDPMGPMGDTRRSLPVYNFKEKLLTTIRDNHVTVVEGETGSGKTTQVPQFVLEDAAMGNRPANIIIAQPRRISAMSVAERVAAERGEQIGGTVGYTIRLESKANANTRLLFCTTGILLKRLEEDKQLTNVTHVFVDEVHERSIESDFLLMVLKDMLPTRGPDNPLKIILMSATLDASLFHDYFWGAPSVKFPGRTFPVAEIYLEDIVEITGHQIRGNEDWARKGNNNNNGNNFGPGGSVTNNPNREGDSNRMFIPNHSPPSLQEKDDEMLTPMEMQQRYSKYSQNTQLTLGRLDHNAIDYPLVVQTIQFLSSLQSPTDAAGYLPGGRRSAQSDEGENFSNAILVFLPGIKEITTLQEMLTNSPMFRNEPARSWVLPIHSTVPPEEQRLVFARPPGGVRKIVLATNIAETAITIDDVAFVVDTGRMKENRYDPLKRMSSLEDCLVSKANARQRRGRAGRVREGVAVHLFTRHRHDIIANAAQPPEVQRVPLEQLVLRIKALKYPGTAAQVCARLVEPPTPEAVGRAVEELVFLEALVIGPDAENGEALTALGTHLSTLPVDCRIGKLILLGAMFGVCDEALTIAAVLSYRSPFQAPMMKREEADRAKMQFATGQSDLLTVLNAYNVVDKMGNARWDFCRENFLSVKTLQTIAGLKRQFLELLSASGFVRHGLRSRAVEGVGRRVDGSDGVKLALEQGVNAAFNNGGMHGNNGAMAGDFICANCGINNFARNTLCFKCGCPKEQSVAPEPTPPPVAVTAEGGGGRWGEESSEDGSQGMDEEVSTEPLLKALLVAALFPQMVIVEGEPSTGGKKGGGGGMKLTMKPEAGDQDKPALHPSSIANKGQLASKYLVYHERVKTTRVYIRDATPVSPYALILFGGGKMEIEKGAEYNESVFRLDGWLGFRCPKKDHLLVMQLRSLLDGILRHKVENPKVDFSVEAENVVQAVKELLVLDSDGKVVRKVREVDGRSKRGHESAFDKLKKTSNGGKGNGGKGSGNKSFRTNSGGRSGGGEGGGGSRGSSRGGAGSKRGTRN